MRIEHEKKSHLSIWLGVLAAVAVGAGAYYYTHTEATKKRTAHFDASKPIPSDAQLRATLKEEQYHVTRENGTEPAFQNLYWNNMRTGLYIDIISGEPLFSSLDKFDSKNGRPNFTKPLVKESLVEKPDNSFDMQRIEVRAIKSNSHLGHLFHDGPPPTGLRYTVNSAALRFIPVEKLEEEGYADFLPLFSPTPGASASPQNANR